MPMTLPGAEEVRAGALETPRPRLGFLGVGWIGRSRMEAVVESGLGDVVAICDPSPAMCGAALESAPGARRVDDLDALLACGLDGVVIATPSALHAEQSIAAIERGMAVFCQKPLGRSSDEIRRVVGAAREADRPVRVDLSYRWAKAMRAVREVVASGELGDVYAVDLVFHNAYGPDKAWFYDAALAGGGCVMDLGTHLVDLALWTLGFPAVEGVTSRLHSGGAPMALPAAGVEDHATAVIDLATGASVRLACSWRLAAGRDAVISASFFGTRGGAAVHNVDGSFYDFVAERYRGTSREQISAPPDAWGGRAVVDWVGRLREGGGFDPEADHLVDVAAVLDRIYGR
jgi:predicted dehydrogenase